MSITVEQLCQLPIFEKHLKLWGGKKGLQNEVRYITIIDSPTIPEPRYKLDNDNVFVLSTFHLYKDQPKLACEAIRSFAKMRIAALGIMPIFHTKKISEELKSISDELDLPLFIVDTEMPMRRIISAVNREIAGEYIEMMQNINAQYTAVCNTALHGDSLDSFIQQIGNNLGRPCICLSKSGMLLASHMGNNANPQNVFSPFVNQPIGEQFFSRAPVSDVNPYFRMNGCYIFPCTVNKHIEGFFLVKSESDLTPTGIATALQMVFFFSVKLMEELLYSKSQHNLVSAILDEILFRPNDDDVVQQRLNLLGFIPGKYYRFLAFSQNVKQRDIFFSFSGICDMLHFNLKPLFPGMVAYPVNDMFIVIAPMSEACKYQNDKNLSCALKRILESLAVSEQIVVTFSQNQTELSHITECYKSVKQTIRYSKLFPSKKCVYSYEDFASVRIVSNLIGTKENDRILDTVIHPIKQYDKQYHTNLWETLTICIETNNLGSAANALHIHSSTLRYRMQKIASLTNYSYFSADGKFVLNIACILERLNQPTI